MTISLSISTIFYKFQLFRGRMLILNLLSTCFDENLHRVPNRALIGCLGSLYAMYSASAMAAQQYKRRTPIKSVVLLAMFSVTNFPF